jgi:hypothetical protein
MWFNAEISWGIACYEQDSATAAAQAVAERNERGPDAVSQERIFGLPERVVALNNVNELVIWG